MAEIVRALRRGTTKPKSRDAITRTAGRNVVHAAGCPRVAARSRRGPAVPRPAVNLDRLESVREQEGSTGTPRRTAVRSPHGSTRRSTTATLRGSSHRNRRRLSRRESTREPPRDCRRSACSESERSPRSGSARTTTRPGAVRGSGRSSRPQTACVTRFRTTASPTALPTTNPNRHRPALSTQRVATSVLRRHRRPRRMIADSRPESSPGSHGRAPTARRRARCGPCGGGPPGSHGRRGCASAGGSRAPWRGGGCSGWKVRLLMICLHGPAVRREKVGRGRRRATSRQLVKGTRSGGTGQTAHRRANVLSTGEILVE